MAKRPVFWPELAKFFQELREAKGWGQRQAADIAQRQGLRVLTRQVLLRLETGQTKNPKPEVLRAVAMLYDVPYEAITTRVAGDVFAMPSAGRGKRRGSNVELEAARARIRELEDEVRLYEAFLRQARALSEELHNFTTAGIRAVSGPPTRRR